MAYKKNADIIAELEVLNIAYSDEMDNEELQALLDEATDLPIVDDRHLTHANIGKARKAQAQAEEVNLGVSTINYHEKRIFAIEQQLKE